MSSPPPTLGVVPKLLPVTGTFLLPLSLGHVLLSLNTVRIRLQTRTLNGDHSSTPAGNPRPPSDDPLYMQIRAHANFLENVPLALLLSAGVELNGGSRSRLALAMAFVLAARASHVLGLVAASAPARIFGYYGTMSAVLGMGGWVGWLCRGYWGA